MLLPEDIRERINRLAQDHSSEISELRNSCISRNLVSVLLVEDENPDPMLTTLMGVLKTEGALAADVRPRHSNTAHWKRVEAEYLLVVSTRDQCVAQALVKNVPFDVVLCDIRLDKGGGDCLGLENGGFWIWREAVDGACGDSDFLIYTANSGWLASIEPLFQCPHSRPMISSASWAYEQVVDFIRKCRLKRITQRSGTFETSSNNSIPKLVGKEFRTGLGSALAPNDIIQCCQRWYDGLMFPELRQMNAQNLEQIKNRLLSLTGVSFPEFLIALESTLFTPKSVDGLVETPRHLLGWATAEPPAYDTNGCGEWVQKLIADLKGADEIQRFDVPEVRGFRERYLPDNCGDWADYCRVVHDLTEQWDKVYNKGGEWFDEEWRGFTNTHSADVSFNQRLIFWKPDLDDIWRIMNNNAKDRQFTATVLKPTEIGSSSLMESANPDQIHVFVQTGGNNATDEEYEAAFRSLRNSPPTPHHLSHLRFLVCDVYGGMLRWWSGDQCIECNGPTVESMDCTGQEGVYVELIFPLLRTRD